MVEAPTTESTQPKPLSALASEMFGSDFVGEVPPEEKAPEQPEEKPEEQPAEEVADEPEEEAEEAEEEAGEEQADETSGEDGETEEAISTVSELVAQNEWDGDWFKGLTVPVKVDGASGEASIDDLVRSFQMTEAADKRLDDAKVKAKEIVDDASVVAQSVQEQAAIAGKLIEKLEGEIDVEATAIDPKLKTDDPGVWAAKMADIAGRRERLATLKNDARQEFKRSQEQQVGAQNEERRQLLMANQAALLEAVPEWSDQETAKADLAKLTDYLIGRGFLLEDVTAASDHRLILMARDAMQFDELKTKGKAAKKRVAKVPLKALKPGAPKPQSEIKSREAKQARANLKKSGSIDDAFAVMQATRRS